MVLDPLDVGLDRLNRDLDAVDGGAEVVLVVGIKLEQAFKLLLRLERLSHGPDGQADLDAAPHVKVPRNEMQQMLFKSWQVPQL